MRRGRGRRVMRRQFGGGGQNVDDEKNGADVTVVKIATQAKPEFVPARLCEILAYLSLVLMTCNQLHFEAKPKIVSLR